VDPTPAQKAKLKELRDTFGKDAVGKYRVESYTGHMRVELKALAGVWHWTFDADAKYLVASMEMRLFDSHPAQPMPGNALDN
jgi:hypothetical protein